jgi:hypothetical protein
MRVQAPNKLGSQTGIGPSLEDQPRLRQTSLLSACNSQCRKRCRAAVYARAGNVTVRHFCDWVGRSARHSLGRLAMPQSQRFRTCAATKKGARGAIRTQFSSISHLDRSDDFVDTQRARCHRKELGGNEAVVN